jgi:hypothetical protein
MFHCSTLYKTALVLCAPLWSASAVEPQESLAVGAAPVQVHEQVKKAYNEARQMGIGRWLERMKKVSNPADAEVAFFSLSNLELTPEEEVPLLRESLQHPSRVVRENALIRLEHCSVSAAPASTDIIRILNDPDTDVNVRSAAVSALSKIVPGNPEAAAAIAKQFEYSVMPPRLKRGIAQALGNMGSSAQPYLAKLKECLADPDLSIQYTAYCGIGHAVDTAGWLSNPDSAIDTAGVLDIAREWKALSTPSFPPEQNSTHLAQLLREARGEARRYRQCVAIVSLGSLRDSDTNALEVLLDLAGADDPFLANLAKGSLIKIPKSASSSLPVLQNALRNSHTAVTVLAANLLRDLGQDAGPAVTELIRVLRKANSHTPHYVIGAVLDALRSIGRAAANSSPILVEMLQEQNPLYRDYGSFEVHYLRGYVLATLADVGVPDDAFPFVLDALANSRNTGSHIFAGAARACAAMGPRAAAAAPFLLRALQTGSSEHLVSFERYFIRISSNARNTTAKIEAVRALGALRAEARAAVPALEELAARQEDPDEGALTPPLKEEAAKALLAIRAGEPPVN